MARISTLQRHTRRSPCPVCGGGDDDRRGCGVRCSMGFLSSDGEYAHCGRPEYGGRPDPNGVTFAHKLGGPCPWCDGRTHGDGAPIKRREKESEKPREWRGRQYLPETTRNDKDGEVYRRAVDYEYRDAQGELAYLVRRFELAGLLPNGVTKRPKTFRQYGHRGGDMWVNRLEVDPILFNLPALLAAPPDAPVYVCEGEKAAEAAQQALTAAGAPGVATSASGSAGGARRVDMRPLAGRRVVILPDADLRDPGAPDLETGSETYAKTFAQRARQAGAAQVVTVALEGLPDHGDIVEWLAVPGHDGAELTQLAELALDASPDETPDEDESEPRGPSVATQIASLALAADGPDLWHDAEGDAWVTFPVAAREQIVAHRETCRLQERSFRRWLAARLYATARKQPGAQALQDALLTLEGIAAHERPQRIVATRLASDPERPETIYLDLADDTWRVVRITAARWDILTPDEAAALPVRFRRPRGMAALPLPTRSGSLAALRPFVNVRDDDGWRLIVAWLVAALRPTGPYPVLSLTGEQGTAKTTLARMLRALVDPNRAPMRRAPRDERDLMIAATNSWMVALDNLSSLPIWLSDALCVLATGGGFATRALWENDGEAIFNAQRPIILTGIEEAATRGDLVDRALIINLEAIPDEQRVTEAKLWADFGKAQPGILGALLDVVAGALHDLPHVRLDGHPRMADFAEWATAAEDALNWQRGAFMRAYLSNRRDANDVALDASPVAGALLALLDDATIAPDRRWNGTAIQLLEKLAAQVSEQVSHSPAWPKSPRGLTGALKRLAPNLRRAGLTISHVRSGHTRARLISLSRASGDTSLPANSPGGEEQHEGERVGAQPSASSASSASADASNTTPGVFSDDTMEESEEARTVLRTVANDNAPTVREPSAGRPQGKPRNHAGSHIFADGADGADGSAPTFSLSLSSVPAPYPPTGGKRGNSMSLTADCDHPPHAQHHFPSGEIVCGHCGAHLSAALLSGAPMTSHGLQIAATNEGASR